MSRLNIHPRATRLIAVATVLAATATACGASATDSESEGGPLAGAPSWCGSKKTSLGLTDGFGGNSWRVIARENARLEADKCPSVTSFDYADGQGNTEKAISDIQGLVAKGTNALVVFPDAGAAVLPAIRSAFKAGVTVVPYRQTPGGKEGVDYTKYVGLDATPAGEMWGEWLLKALPEGGNVLNISGTPGNSQGMQGTEGLHKVLDPTGKFNFIGNQPFELTKWDPAVTQQVLTAAIAKYPKIDAIVSDYGPSLVGALPEFEKSGRSIPALATSDGNVLACFYEDHKASNPDFELFTISTQTDHVRLAVQWAVALATGGTPPTEDYFPNSAYEDSIAAEPNAVTCKSDLPGDTYLSSEMSGEDQAKLLK